MPDLTQRISRLSAARIRLLQQELQIRRPPYEPIAIVGMSCRLPGAPDLASYWRLLSQGERVIGPIPAGRWNQEDFYDPAGGVGRTNVSVGGFLEGIDRFDASFFGISPREAAKMDPQQRLLLEVTWEALEHAGLAPERLTGSSTGVFIGIGAADYAKVPLSLDDYYGQIDAHSGTGNALSIAANRISYLFDWNGPSLSIDTACSSSLVALHAAAKSLQDGESELAVAGGVNLILAPETMIAFSNARMLSPDGHCRPFDARANGYVRGEGVGLVVLKRLTDAVTDGDRVLAVMGGSAVNQDGRTSGITSPNSGSQAAVIRRALRAAGLTPDDISYLEAHGTGTPLGDPIEWEALRQVFSTGTSDRPCYLSSVKSNIGHLETAAGIASVIKVVLMMMHEQYVPQVEFRELNPHISLNGERLRIARAGSDWTPASGVRRAGVSSFGFGGTNAHLILEQAEAASFVAEPPPPGLAEPGSSAEHRHEPRPHLLALSARSSAALQTLAGRYADYLQQHPGVDLEALCYTANVGRNQFSHRLTFTATTAASLQEQLAQQAALPGPVGSHHGFQSPKVAFLFTGQGGQYPGMGQQLFRDQPVFRQTLLHCDQILQEPLGTSILEVMHEEADRSRLSETRFTQPALFALEYALAQLWRSWGVEPIAMLGHSVGEYVAATLAGVFDLDDGLRLIARRGQLMQRCPQQGAMAAVFAPPEQLERMLHEGLDTGLPPEQLAGIAIAAYNGPAMTVLSGDRPQLERFTERLAADGIKATFLPVSHAFHSPLMDEILEEFQQFASTIEMRTPRIPLVSNLTGEVFQQAPDADYWRDHLRQAVRFEQGMRTLVGLGPDVLLESGPSPNLLSMGRRFIDHDALEWLPSLRSGQPDRRVILQTLARLYERGAPIRWSGQFTSPPPAKLTLPSYPFERKRHWYGATGRPASSPLRTADRHAHPLLGSEFSTATGARIFTTQLHPEQPAYLAEHRVQGSTVTPAAAYLEQALAAADQLFGEGLHQVAELSIQQAMFLKREQPRQVQCSANAAEGERCQIRIHSREAETGSRDDWTLHAVATVVRQSTSSEQASPAPSRQPPAPPAAEPHAVVSGEKFYELMRQQGLDYGPRFQVLSELRRGEGEAWAKVVINEDVRQESARHRIHPALLDGCLQAIAGIVPVTGEGSIAERLYLPSAVGRLRLFGDPTRAAMIHVRRCEEEEATTIETLHSDVQLLDQEGHVLAELQGVRVQSLGATASRDDDRGSRLYQIDWQPTAAPAADAADTVNGQPATGAVWMVVAGAPPASDSAELAQQVAAQLRKRSARCILVHPGDTFSAVGTDTFEIAADRLEDYHRLFEEAFPDSPAQCSGIIQLARFDELSEQEAGSEPLQSEGFWAGPMRLLQQVARSRFASSPPVWICTRGAQAIAAGDDCQPRQAMLWGLGRTASLESPGPVRLLDLDQDATSAANARTLVAELAREDGESQLAIRQGQRYAARLAETHAENLNVSAATARGSSLALPPAPFRLKIGRAGSFDELRLESCRLPSLGPDQVQLRIHSTGLNFSDVLKAMGLYPGITDLEPPLGIECAGVVTAVGKEVTRFAVGDQVMGVAPYSFASHAITAHYTLTPLPRGLSYEEAATIPITFLTAQHALCSLARIQAGERVLIHAGAGGVGLAAIQIAQHVGAEIFATAGSDTKRDFLRSLGVQHVFNSRTTEFAEQILAETGREGVDVVLNSLPGEAIHKSLGILRAYGRFLEIGKTDIYQDQMIGLAPFQDNLSYFAIDLDRMLRQRPREIQQLYSEVMQRLEQGVYQALPHKIFPASETASAFRYMAQRKNIGKIVVSFSETESAPGEASAGEAPVAAQPAIRADASYLITGGLGALGLRLAEWLIQSGAEHIVLASRRPPSESQQERLRQFPSEAQVCCIQADVAEASSLRAGLQQIPDDWPPLAGVIHAAGVLADGLLYDMSPEDFQHALRPKVDGGWNLHQASGDWPLDFFLLFSSVASVLGSPGQANYAAGNAFLDALTVHRRAQGQPATVINWGPWADGGMATAEHRAPQIHERGMRSLDPTACLEWTEHLIRAAPAPQAIVLDIDWAALSKQFPGTAPSLLANFADRWEDAAAADDEQKVDREFLRRFAQASSSERQALLQEYLTLELARILGAVPSELEPEQPLSLVGIDSLMAMELRANLETQLAIEVPMAVLMDGPSITSLTNELLPMLSAPAGAGSPEPGSAAAAPTDAPTDASSRPAASLLPLQTHPVQPALFCLHPIGGDLRCYQALAKHLGQHRCVMTVRPRGADGFTEPHDQVETLAEEYCQLIRRYQPTGPYLLLGWSTGGIFAYEIARQLLANGQAVDLSLVDTPTSDSLDHVELDDDVQFLYNLARFSNWFSGASVEFRYDELKALGMDRAIERVLAETTQHGVLPKGTTRAHLEHRVEMARTHLQAVLNYDLQPLGQPVHLYRPEQSAVLALATGRQMGDDLGWRPILGSDLQMQRVPGDHFSMLTGKHAEQLAEALRRQIEQQLRPQT